MTPLGLSGSSQAKATLCLVISLAWIKAIGDGAARRKKTKKNQEFSCNEKHVFLITAFTTWALPEMEIFLLQRLESLSIFPGFANKIVFNPL